jgi:hypothetical protein
MANRKRNRAAQTLIEEMPIDVLDVLQDKLREFLGKAFTLVLAGSGGTLGARNYHLQIYRTRTDLSIETHGAVQGDFIEQIFKVARQMKAMMGNTAALEQMGGNNNVRLLCWMSDASGTPHEERAVNEMRLRSRSFQQPAR